MTDNIVFVFIFPAILVAVADSGLFQIQRMKVDISEHALDAGDPCAECKLVGVRRIYDKAGFVVRRCKLIGDLRTELCRMLHSVGAALCMVEKHIVHFVCAALDSQKSAASSYKRIDRSQIDVCLFKGVQNRGLAVRKLITDRLELFELFRVVRNVHGKDLFLSFEAAYLSGCGTRIHGQNAIFHLLILLYIMKKFYPVFIFSAFTYLSEQGYDFLSFFGHSIC